MYKIAICDDETCTCHELEQMLRESSLMSNPGLEIDVFYSGENLIAYLKNGVQYDFVILDIELVQLNGVDVGKYIREINHDFHTQIIFISSKDSYAMRLFAVSPLDFLIKPVSPEALMTVIKRGIAVLVDSGVFFVCKCGKEHIVLNCNEILYLTSDKRVINVVCKDGIVRYYGKLSQETEKLPDCFLQIHSSYIINLNAVRKSGKDYVLMNNGEIIRITRKYSDKFKEKVLLRFRKYQGGM